MHALVDVTIAASPSRTRDLRRVLTLALTGDVPPPCVEDAVLVVHELISAAFLNGTGPFHVRVERSPSYLQAAVTDRGGRLPSGVLQPDGRGGTVAFQMVEAVADTWGVAHLPAETVLWAKVLLS